MGRMARRLYKTTADYLAIAITPALIMALVTSLVFFLLLVFYRGAFHGRLQYILFLFVFAAVLIARIAMEEGRERAMVFSLALAAATALAVNRFSDLGTLANLFFLGLIWWCADRLTWDCTLIDEHENVAGEGLLQTVGLDRPPPENAPNGDADVEPLSVTGSLDAAERKPLWRRLWERLHKPRAPGVWVVYFSLAALPIFGFGQRFLIGDEPRRAAFRYLVVYVASALGLLLATCFLGLRRYLRQRRVEMPNQMAAVWITLGCGLIVALLTFCMLLPRPRAEYAISQVPLDWETSRKLLASRFGWGNEGIRDDHTPNPAPGKYPNSAHEDLTSVPSSTVDANSESQGPPTAGDTPSATSAPGDQTSSNAGPTTADHTPGAQQEEQSPSSSQQRTSQLRSPSPSGGEGEPSRSDSPSSPEFSQDESAPSEHSADSVHSPEREQAAPQHDAFSPRETPLNQDHPSQTSRDVSPPSEPQPPTSAPQRLRPPLTPTTLLGWLATLAKLIFYALLCAVGVWLFTKYKDDLVAGARELWQDFLRRWRRLFGRGADQETSATPAEEPRPRYRPFADYADPFATRKVARYTPEQLVRYSFEALEAWARERGCARPPEQTPHEFAQQISSRHANMSQPVRALAELYSRLAYAPGPLPTSTIDHLKQLWASLRK